MIFSPLASLSMYDWPEVRSATDMLWQEMAKSLRSAGFNPPSELTREGDIWAIWRSSELVLAHTCGHPYAAFLSGNVSLVTTPVYDLDCPDGMYRSVLICRKNFNSNSEGRLSNQVFAFNDLHSQSGLMAPTRWLEREQIKIVPPPFCSGSHRNSILAVANGQADFAAIDEVSWKLALRHEPAARHLQVFDQTDPTPALPLITARTEKEQLERLRHAVAQAINNLDKCWRDVLFLRGVCGWQPTDYAALGIRPNFTEVFLNWPVDCMNEEISH